MKTWYLLLLLFSLPTLFLAQSKKEEILLLNSRIDSLTIVCNTLNSDKSLLQKEQIKLKEECATEKSLLQNELSATQKQLESVKKTFQNERELRLQITEQKRRDSLHFVSEIATLQEAAAQKEKSLNGIYYNSKNQVFTISNYITDQAFDFSYQYGVNDEWECMREYEGTAQRMTTEPDESNEITYYVGEIDYPYLKFKISNGNTIYLQADPEFIGFDCAKFGESQEETYTKFVKR